MWNTAITAARAGCANLTATIFHAEIILIVTITTIATTMDMTITTAISTDAVITIQPAQSQHL
jgi:hypothetical protein